MELRWFCQMEGMKRFAGKLDGDRVGPVISSSQICAAVQGGLEAFNCCRQ